MSLENESIAGATLELLEARLNRIEYLLTGKTEWTGKPSPAPKLQSLEATVARRLVSLEKKLDILTREHLVVRNILKLYAEFPDLFDSIPSQFLPPNLSPQNLASIVLSFAAAFPETASRLTSLNDLPIPDAKTSAFLIELQPRLNKLAAIQEQQALEISSLRLQSARILQRWYEIGLLGAGECWAEWESRLEDIDREVRREEVGRERRAKNI